MYLWLEIFLLSAGITSRLIISASTSGAGLNLLVNLFIWSAFLLHLINYQVRFTHCKKDTSIANGHKKLNLLLFLFGLFIIAGFIYAPYKFSAFGYLLQWLSDILLFYIVYNLCLKQPTPILFVALFLSNAVVIILCGLYQHLWGLKDLLNELQANPQLLKSIPVELQEQFVKSILGAEPFATFTYQNSLGAFLVLVFPILPAVFISLIKIKNTDSKNQILRLALVIVSTILSIFILIKTNSKGAWGTCIFALILMAISGTTKAGLLPLSSRRQRIILSIFLALFIIVVSLTLYIIFLPENPHWVKGLPESLLVRFDYWRATVQIIKNNIINGVGLNQFGSDYLYYKSISAGETTKAHNDYLQIASELGLPAFIVFILIWFIILGKFKPLTSLKALPIQPSDRPTVRPMIWGVAFAFLISEIFQNPVIAIDIPFISTLILFALWSVSFLIWIKIEFTPLLITGLFCALLGFLLHSTLDFNLYVPGLSMSMWFLGAIFYGLTSGSTLGVYPSGTPRSTLYALTGLTTFILLILCVISTLLIQYDSLLEQGKSFARSSSSQEREQSIKYLKQAQGINSYAVEPLLELTWIIHHNYCGKDTDAMLKMPCIYYLKQAISLSPLSAMLYYQQGLLYKEHAIFLEQLNIDPERGVATESRRERTRMANLYLQYSERSFKTLLDLYPTFNREKEVRRIKQ
jgi:hypothetical protein